MSGNQANPMVANQADRSHFERQILFARPIFVLLALLAALEQPSSRQERRSVSFLIAYLVLRSEEHTSELQSQSNLVCRLLLEKKKKSISESILRPSVA